MRTFACVLCVWRTLGWMVCPFPRWHCVSTVSDSIPKWERGATSQFQVNPGNGPATSECSGRRPFPGSRPARPPSAGGVPAAPPLPLEPSPATKGNRSQEMQRVALQKGTTLYGLCCGIHAVPTVAAALRGLQRWLHWSVLWCASHPCTALRKLKHNPQQWMFTGGVIFPG